MEQIGETAKREAVKAQDRKVAIEGIKRGLESMKRSSKSFSRKKEYVRLVNQSNLPSPTLAEIEAEISQQENLLDVMRWAAAMPDEFLPTVVANVVVQDEFTHDVIVPWRDLVLVYDTT